MITKAVDIKPSWSLSSSSSVAAPSDDDNDKLTTVNGDDNGVDDNDRLNDHKDNDFICRGCSSAGINGVVVRETSKGVCAKGVFRLGEAETGLGEARCTHE